MDITEFLTARLDEDQKTAEGLRDMVTSLNEINNSRSAATRQGTHVYDAGLWALNRLLAEIAAKRWLIDPLTWAGGPETEDAYQQMLLGLAALYADHPDFDPAWAVNAPH